MVNKERIEMIEHIHNQEEKVHEFDIDWLIEQANKVEKYEKALSDIVNHRKDSLSSYCDNYGELVEIASDALM